MSRIKLVSSDGSMGEVLTELLVRARIIASPIIPRTNSAPSAIGFVEEIGFRRPSIIPQLVRDQRFHIGITGQDWLTNSGIELPTLFVIPRGRATMNPPRIVLAVKNESSHQNIADLPTGCRIVSEYGRIARNYCLEHGRDDIEVFVPPGHAEATVRDVNAEATIELTEQGHSLKAHDLHEIDAIMTTNTIIVGNPEALEDPELRPYMDCVVAAIAGAWKAQNEMIYVIANVPNHMIAKVAAVMVGLRAPTVSPTTDPELSSLAAFMPVETHHEVIVEMMKLGVTDIATFEAGTVRGASK